MFGDRHLGNKSIKLREMNSGLFFTYPLAPFLVKEGGTHLDILVLTIKARYMRYYEIKKIASKLRRNQTPSEKLLWSYLRNRQLNGREFNRQHPIIYESNKNEHFFFIPDFYCDKEKLIIEVDGEIHMNQIEKDNRRD